MSFGERVHVPGTIDAKTGFPKNSLPIPNEQIPEEGYRRMCCDARKGQCGFARAVGTKVYCTYTPQQARTEDTSKEPLILQHQ